MNKEYRIDGKTIETDRLILRAFRESDLQDFYRYASIEGVGEMAGWHHHESIEESEEILKMFIDEDKTFAITLKDGGKTIGSLGIEKYDEGKCPELDGASGREIGYVLSKAYWGMGIMPEALRAVITYLFDEVKLDFILCGHYDFNHQSFRVQEKCGFQFYKASVFSTRMGTTESGKLNILYNPNGKQKL